MPEKYKSIDGWFDVGFSKVYDRLIEECQDGDIIVEVGCWKGCSSCYLLEKAQELNKRPKIYFFDSWTGDATGPYGSIGSMLPEFIKNLNDVGFSEVDDFNATAINGLEVPKLFEDNSVFAVMIDDQHYHGYVKEELDMWKPKIKTGGIITFHDYPDVNLNPVFNSLGNVEDYDSCGLWRKI